MILRKLSEISATLSSLQARAGNLRKTTNTEAGLVLTRRAGLVLRAPCLWNISLTQAVLWEAGCLVVVHCKAHTSFWWSAGLLPCECYPEVSLSAQKFEQVLILGASTRTPMCLLFQDQSYLFLLKPLHFSRLSVPIMQIIFTNTVSVDMQAGEVVFLIYHECRCTFPSCDPKNVSLFNWFPQT